MSHPNYNDPASLSDAHELSLAPEERVAGRFALQARMSLSLSEQEKADIRRVIQHAVYTEPVPSFSWNTLFDGFRLPTMALAALLLLSASGGGLVYAAEYAIPGDPLYGVKIHVTEAVRARFISPEHRPRWALLRLERRIDELHRLEARGKAEEEIDVVIGDRIEAAAHDVEVEVEALPAAAAERAAMRTAIRSAIGTEDADLRRASRINRVLKALKDRAETFDAPVPTTIAPVPRALRDTAAASVRASSTRSSRTDDDDADDDSDNSDNAVDDDDDSNEGRDSNDDTHSKNDDDDDAPIAVPPVDIDAEGGVNGTIKLDL